MILRHVPISLPRARKSKPRNAAQEIFAHVVAEIMGETVSAACDTQKSPPIRGKKASQNKPLQYQLLNWLGRQDSNLEMLFRKMPFEISGRFRLISERLGTRDFSRMSCKMPTCSYKPASWIQTSLRAKFLDIS